MCQCSRIPNNSPANKHRRRGAFLASMTCVLGVIPALMSHWSLHPRVVWSVITLQILLLALALHQLSVARRLSSTSL